jgi:hypothetical protein
MGADPANCRSCRAPDTTSRTIIARPPHAMRQMPGRVADGAAGTGTPAGKSDAAVNFAVFPGYRRCCAGGLRMSKTGS